MATRPQRSIEERLTRAQVAIDNALADTALQDALAGFGYTAEKLQEGRQLYDTARELHQTKRPSTVATDALQTAWDETKTVYMRHVKVARVAFKRERGIWEELALSGEQKQSLSGWLTQANQFYTNALGNPDVLAALGEFGITQEKPEAGRDLVDAVEAANAAQEKEKGEAQDATKARDAALDVLDDWMSDFVAIARVPLEDRPQQLEKLGVVEPS